MERPVYDKNIEALNRRFSNAVGYLDLPVSDKAPIIEEDGLTAEVRNVCGKSVLCAVKGDNTYQLDSLYDSKTLLDLWFASLGDEWDLDTRLIMYGLGNGEFARKFLKSGRKDCTIVVHEPSEVLFRAALENFDMTDLFTDNRFRLVFWPADKGKDDVKNYYYREVFDYRNLGSQKYSFYPNYPRLFNEDCNMFINEIDGAGDYIMADQLVHDRFGEDYNRNTFNNLTLVTDSLSFADLIRFMPEGVPAIVVAGGPSLDKNIRELKAAKGKCIIISTDTALKPLALAGIEPDLTAIMDGKKDARYLSEEQSRYIPMICTLRSGDTFINLHRGVKFFTDYYCDHIKHFMDTENCEFAPLPTGGSIANACFGIAETLHCKKIILVGQDLAYTGDKTHSKVTVRGEKETAVEDLEHPVMGVDINGDPIRTSLEFQVYKEWFEREIRMHPDMEVIDATEGGILIEGSTLMTLREAIERECTQEFDFKSVISKVGKLIPDNKRQKYLDYIGKIPGEMENLKGLINKAVMNYRKLRELVRADKYHSSEAGKLYKDCQNISDMIENSPVIEYVHYQMQDRSTELLDKVNKLEKDEKKELLTVCEIGEKYLLDMLDALNELSPYVEKMQQKLEQFSL